MKVLECKLVDAYRHPFGCTIGKNKKFKIILIEKEEKEIIRLSEDMQELSSCQVIKDILLLKQYYL